jgi:hypothetical protein
MKRWIALALILWLASVAVIAAFTAQRLLEPKSELARRWMPTDDARIDGEPAYVLHVYTCSNVTREGAPAWRMRELYMVPSAEVPSLYQWHERYWRVVSIDKPFHLTFVLPDATTRGPHRVEFAEEFPTSVAVPAGWNRDGESFAFMTGYTGYPHDSKLLEGRFWNKNTVRQFALEQLVWVGAATAGAVFFVVIVGIIRFLHSRSAATATSRIVPPRT